MLNVFLFFCFFCLSELILEHKFIWTQDIFVTTYYIASLELIYMTNTVERQWLEHLWEHENLFETGVVRAIDGL